MQPKHEAQHNSNYQKTNTEQLLYTKQKVTPDLLPVRHSADIEVSYTGPRLVEHQLH